MLILDSPNMLNLFKHSWQPKKGFFLEVGVGLCSSKPHKKVYAPPLPIKNKIAKNEQKENESSENKEVVVAPTCLSSITLE